MATRRSAPTRSTSLTVSVGPTCSASGLGRLELLCRILHSCWCGPAGPGPVRLAQSSRAGRHGRAAHAGAVFRSRREESASQGSASTRVKNNMQIISSLIRMQERVHTSPDETIRRVQAMALVHDLIYSHGDFASVKSGCLCPSLVGGRAARTPTIRRNYDLQLEPVTIALDRAMPFALILSEVVTQCGEPHFCRDSSPITIVLRREGLRSNSAWTMKERAGIRRSTGAVSPSSDQVARRPARGTYDL